jgi:outer membrane protein assembly factor BamB
MSGFRGSALLAIRLDAARGDLTAKPEATAWSRQSNTPYVPSPLLYDGILYFLRVNKGHLTAVASADGKAHYEVQNLEGIREVRTSPVGAAGRVYVTGMDGLTFVIRHGPKFEVLARNKLNDSFTASAALVDRELYLRGEKTLYCIAEDGGE